MYFPHRRRRVLQERGNFFGRSWEYPHPHLALERARLAPGFPHLKKISFTARKNCHARVAVLQELNPSNNVRDLFVSLLMRSQ